MVSANGSAAPPIAASVPTSTQGAPAMKIHGISIPGGKSPAKMVGAAILVAVLGVGGWYLKNKFLPKKGVISYASLSVDKSKPLADDLYKGLGKDATKWKRDATFWSLNLHAVRMDGTVDVSKPAVIEYVSPLNSASGSKKTRSDSLRKYTASGDGVRGKSWGWNEPVRDLEPHRTPACSIKQLLGKLSSEGVLKTPTVRVFFDPKFADFYAWTLFVEGEPKPKSYSWENCEQIK